MQGKLASWWNVLHLICNSIYFALAEMHFSGCEIKPDTSFSPQTVPVSDLSPHTSPNSPLSYTLTRLIGGNNYTFWMTSSTVQGDGGVHSEPLILLLPEDGQSDTRTHKRSINEDKVNTHTRKILLGKLDNNCMWWFRVSPEGRSALFFSELFNLKKKLHKNAVIENSFQCQWKEIKRMTTCDTALWRQLVMTAWWKMLGIIKREKRRNT